MKHWLLMVSIAIVFVKGIFAETKLVIAGDDKTKVWITNERRVVSCTSITSNVEDEIEWISPQGKVVMGRPLRRVYSRKTIQPPEKGFSLNLIFSRTSVEDTGDWMCKSGNVVRKFSVCVVDPPTNFDNIETLVLVNVGSSVKLRCKANFGDPEPRLQWYRDGQIITDNNNTKYKTLTISRLNGIEVQLTVVSIEDEDAGVYVCQTLQESNENCILTLSRNISLQVRSPSKEIFTAENSEERVHLECMLKNRLKHKYWYGENNIDIESTLIDVNENKNSLLQVSKKNVNAKLIYVAKEKALVNSATANELMEINQINGIYDNDLSSKIYIIILNNNITELKDLYIEYLQMESTSQRFTEMDWKTADRMKIRTNNIFCNKDEYIVLNITGFLEGTDYFLRLRTKLKPSAETHEELTTTKDDPNHLSSSANDDSTNLTKLFLDIIHDSGKLDIILDFGATSVFLIILIIFIVVTYYVCIRCRKTHKNSLPPSES